MIEFLNHLRKLDKGGVEPHIREIWGGGGGGQHENTCEEGLFD